jgi:hypothetical protein
VGAPLDLLVQTLEQVGRLQVLVLLARQAVEAQRLLDVIFDPRAELGISRLQLGQPGGEIALGLGEVAPVVQPTERAQSVVVDLARPRSSPNSAFASSSVGPSLPRGIVCIHR